MQDGEFDLRGLQLCGDGQRAAIEHGQRRAADQRDVDGLTSRAAAVLRSGTALGTDRDRARGGRVTIERGVVACMKFAASWAFPHWIWYSYIFMN